MFTAHMVARRRAQTSCVPRTEDTMAKSILIITGDGGECYETLYAVHRFREAGYEPRIAAPSRKRLHLVIHDFEPGWDTYVERPGYQLAQTSASKRFGSTTTTRCSCSAAARRNTCATTPGCSRSCASFARARNGSSGSATESRCS